LFNYFSSYPMRTNCVHDRRAGKRSTSSTRFHFRQGSTLTFDKWENRTRRNVVTHLSTCVPSQTFFPERVRIRVTICTTRSLVFYWHRGEGIRAQSCGIVKLVTIANRFVHRWCLRSDRAGERIRAHCTPRKPVLIEKWIAHLLNKKKKKPFRPLKTRIIPTLHVHSVREIQERSCRISRSYGLSCST
jgi:hypothetical protein